jgi:2,4-dienoyl-CoA reductase (NADPH2)
MRLTANSARRVERRFMTDPLFEPIRIHTLEIKNRIAMPAMHLAMAVDYAVTDPILDFYAERAAGGAGMICVGYATVDELSGNTQNIGAHDDAFIPGLTRLATTIREKGARAVVQLNHAGRYNHSFFIGGRQPVAPSAIASKMTRETPKALGLEEIQTIVARFGQAAARVKAAGFDAVELLAATGYLISEFLSPLTNCREDAYGGSLENRMRFGLEVVAAIRRAVGADFPLIVRINGNDFMKGGQGRKQLQAWARALVQDGGVNALCVNVGWHEARVPQIISCVPRGVFAYLARGIKDQVDVPVIASHRINDPGLARELISDGMCDMVAMGRGLIADPQLPEKARSGREAQILHCIACAQGCFDNLFKLKRVECLCNPRAGHERETVLPMTDRPKQVLVVGGGPAGISAAVAAARRGHQVTLCEKSDRLGGQLHLAAAPPGRQEFAQLATDLARQEGMEKVSVRLNTVVDADLLDRQRPDAVILATGALPLIPPIPGIDGPHVVQAWDVLAGRVFTGRRVVVIGGGAVGVETALFLAEKGTLSADAVKFLLVNGAEPLDDLYDMATRGTKEVAVVEMIDKVGKDIGRSTRWAMLQDMARTGIHSLTGAKALEITTTGVMVEAGGKLSQIPADTVVVAAGSQSCNPLEAMVVKRGIAVQVVGDARQVALAFDAIHQGFAAGNRV